MCCFRQFVSDNFYLSAARTTIIMSGGGRGGGFFGGTGGDETYLEAFVESVGTLPAEVKRTLELLKDLEGSGRYAMRCDARRCDALRCDVEGAREVMRGSHAACLPVVLTPWMRDFTSCPVRTWNNF